MMLQIWRILLIYEVLKPIRFSNCVVIPLHEPSIGSSIKVKSELSLKIISMTVEKNSASLQLDLAAIFQYLREDLKAVCS